MTDPGSTGLHIHIDVDDEDEPPHAARLRPEAVSLLVGAVLTHEGIQRARVGVIFCGDERIASLNAEWIGQEGPTDVIAFPLIQEGPVAGDPAPGPDDLLQVEGEVYIDLAQAARQAPEFGVRLEEEVRRLVVHGVLHLLGYDDRGGLGAERMHQRQEELVRSLSEPVLEGAA